jgi:hypothetical protein
MYACTVLYVMKCIYVMYCDMTPESWNSPLLANGSLIHISMTTGRNMTIARKQFGKHIPSAAKSHRIIHCWATVPVATVKQKTE